MESLLPDRERIARVVARPILDEEDNCDLEYEDVEPTRFLAISDAVVALLPTREQIIERIAAAGDDGRLTLTQDEQGPWPGTPAHAQEVREQAAAIADVLLGLDA